MELDVALVGFRLEIRNNFAKIQRHGAIPKSTKEVDASNKSQTKVRRPQESQTV